jgi:hypothetical protein
MSDEKTTGGVWDNLTAKQIEDRVDIGLRHRSGKSPTDYLWHWLSIGRQFGYATKDDSWGEFEKLFAIIIKRLVLAERALNTTEPKT